MATNQEAPGTQHTFSFKLDESAGLVNKLISVLETTKVDQINTFAQLAGAVRGDGGAGAGLGPGLGGGSDLSELTKKAEALATQAGIAEKKGQEVQGLAQQILTNITNTVASGKLPAIAGTKVVDVGRSLVRSPLIGNTVNPTAQGFKFASGGRGTLDDVSLQIGEEKRKKLKGGELSIEQLAALGESGGALSFGKQKVEVAAGTSSADVIKQLATTRLAGAGGKDAGLGVIPTGTSRALFDAILAAGVSGPGTLKDVKKINKELPEGQRLAENKQGVEQLQSVVKELTRTLDSGVRQSSVLGGSGSQGSDASKLRETRVLPGVGSNLNITDFREYVELQKKLAEAVNIIKTSSKGILDPGTVQRLGAAYQVVKRSLEGEQGVVRLIERLAQAVDTVSNAAPRVAALGSQFKGMLDPLRQADTYLKGIAKSVNEIGSGNINIKVSGGSSSARGESNVVAKLPANLDGNLKLVATELAALRTEMTSLRTALAAGRAGGSIAKDTGVRKSEAYGFGLSGIQNQNSFSGTDPLLNPKGALFGNQTKTVKDFNDQVDIAIKRVGLYAAASTGVFAVAQAFSAGAKSIAEVEQRMAQLQFLMNGVRTDLGGLRKEAFAISKEFGFSINQTLDAMVVFAQQGRGMRDTVNLVTTSLAIANQTTLSTVDATEALTAAMSIYGVKAQDSIKIADSWAAVANKNAVSAEVLAGALKKAGGAAVAAGVTFDQLNGFITVINESTRKSGSEIGTSLKYVFQNLAAPETVQLLEKLGVAVYNVNGGVRPTIQIFQELNDKLSTFSDTQRRQVLISIASARHYSDLSLLLRDLDKVYKVIGQSQDAFGTSAKNNQIVLQTLVKQWQNLKTAFSEVAVEIGSGGLLSATKLLVSGLKGVASVANLVPDSFKGIITTAAIFAAGMTAITRATNALTGTAFPTVIEKAVAFRTATAAAGVESVKHSSILLREAAAVNTLAAEYSKLAAAQGGASTRFAAGGSGVRFSSIAAPGGVPGSATPPTTPSAVSGSFRERAGNFVSSGAGQLAIAGAGIVGASVFGDAARKARTEANGANTLKSTAFETLQGASAGAAIGVGFGGPTGALVGGVGGGLFGLIGALSDYKTTLQTSLEINKKNLEVFREQISAVEELQTDLERLQNTKANPLTGKIDNASSVSISPLQTRTLVLETLARIGQTDIKSSSTLNGIFGSGGKDASGLTSTRFSDAAYDIAESNEQLGAFIVDLKATMEDLKFETAKAADALNKADIEDLRARANTVRGGAASIRFQDPFGITSGTNSILGKVTTLLGDATNYVGRPLAGPDNFVGNFLRRQGQGASALGELQSQYDKTGDTRVARVIADLDTVTQVGKKTEEIFDQYRSIVNRAEDPVQSGDLLTSFFKTSLSASSIPYSKDVQKAIADIGDDNVSGFQRFEKRNPLAAREALSVARDTNIRFFNQFYQNRSIGDLSGNLDFQKDFIRRQGLDAAFRPFTRDGIAGASITNATRVGDVFISGKRQEIVTGVDDKGIKSVGVRQNELGLLNIERDEDGNVKVFERTREEYARFVETLDKSATVFARVGDSGRSFSGFISNLEKDSNQVNKVFGRAQEVLARQFSIINRELERYSIGGDAGADPRTQTILTAQSLAASTDLINRRGLTLSPIDTVELPDTIKGLVNGIGKPETIANALAASTSSEDKLRQSIDKLNDTLQNAVFEEVRKANFAKSSVALDAVNVLEAQEKQGNLNATTVRKFFGATTVPFTAEEQDRFAKDPTGLTALARKRLAAVPFDQAISGGKLPGDLGVIANSVSEGVNGNKLGLKELIDRVRDARTVFGVAAQVAREKDLDRVVAQENLQLRRQGDGAVINSENFGEVNLGQFASNGIDASNVDKIEKQFLQFTQLLNNLEDVLNSETNKNIAKQFSIIEQAIAALGTALNKNDLGVQLSKVAEAFTSLSQDASTTAKLFLQFGASRNSAKDELGRALPTRGIEEDLATRIANENKGPLAGKSREEVLDLLRSSRSLAAQRNTGTAVGRAQENIQSFLSKQSVFGLARNDQDVTQTVVSEYKTLVDSLIGERDRLIRDGYEAEAAAIDKLIGKYKELNDKLETQQRQLSPRRQQFLEAAAKDALAQGGPLLGISDELRGVIAGNSRLRQFGVETGALAGVSTKEAAGLKDELAASGDATLKAITELRDKVGEAFGQLPTLDIKFTGIDDLKAQLAELAKNGVDVPVRFRTLDGQAFEQTSSGIVPTPAASGGRVTRDGVLARLHHGEVVVPSQLVGQLPTSITNQLGSVAPQGGVLPMASGGRVGPQLPKDLASSSPRYGYGSYGFNVDFDSDVDKAAYIVAQKKRSKSHDKFLKFLADNGFNENDAVAHGEIVKAHLKTLAQSRVAQLNKVGVDPALANQPLGLSQVSAPPTPFVPPNKISVPAPTPGLPQIGTPAPTTKGGTPLERILSIRAGSEEATGVSAASRILNGVEFDLSGFGLDDKTRGTGGAFIPGETNAGKFNQFAPSKIRIGLNELYGGDISTAKPVIDSYRQAIKTIQQFGIDHPYTKATLTKAGGFGGNPITPVEAHNLLTSLETLKSLTGTHDIVDLNALTHEQFHRRYDVLKRSGNTELAGILSQIEEVAVKDVRAGRNSVLRDIVGKSLADPETGKRVPGRSKLPVLAEEYLAEILTGDRNADGTLGKYKLNPEGMPPELIERIGKFVSEDPELTQIVRDTALFIEDSKLKASGFTPDNTVTPEGLNAKRIKVRDAVEKTLNKARTQLNNSLIENLDIGNVSHIEEKLFQNLKNQELAAQGKSPSLFGHIGEFLREGKYSKFTKPGLRFGGAALGVGLGASALGLIPGLGILGGFAGPIGLAAGIGAVIGPERLGAGYNATTSFLKKLRSGEIKLPARVMEALASGKQSIGEVISNYKKSRSGIIEETNQIKGRSFDIDDYERLVNEKANSVPIPERIPLTLDEQLLLDYDEILKKGDLSKTEKGQMNGEVLEILRKRGVVVGGGTNRARSIKDAVRKQAANIRASQLRQEALIATATKNRADIVKSTAKNAALEANGLSPATQRYIAETAARGPAGPSRLGNAARTAGRFASSERGINGAFMGLAILRPLIDKAANGEEITADDIKETAKGAAFTQAGFITAGKIFGSFANNRTLLGGVGQIGKYGLGPAGALLGGYSFGKEYAAIGDDILTGRTNYTAAGLTSKIGLGGTVAVGGGFIGIGSLSAGGFAAGLTGTTGTAIGGASALGIGLSATGIGAVAVGAGALATTAIKYNELAEENLNRQGEYDADSSFAAKDKKYLARLARLGNINAVLNGGAAGEQGGRQYILNLMRSDDLDPKLRRQIRDQIIGSPEGRKEFISKFEGYGVQDDPNADPIQLAIGAGASVDEVKNVLGSIAASNPEYGRLIATQVEANAQKTGTIQKYDQKVGELRENAIKSRESYWVAKGIRDFVAQGNKFYGRGLSEQEINDYLHVLGEENADYTRNAGRDSIRPYEPIFNKLLSNFPIIGQEAPPRLRQLQARLLEQSILNYGAVPSTALTPGQLAGTEDIKAAYYDFDNELVMEEILRRRKQGMVLDKDNDYLLAKYKAGLGRRALHRGGGLEDAMSYFGSGDMDRVAVDQTGRPVVIRTDEMVLPKTSASTVPASTSEAAVVQQQQNINVRLGGGFQFINEGGGSSSADDIAKIIRDNSNEIARKIAEELSNKPIAIYG